jgi:hypothetical protein
VLLAGGRAVLDSRGRQHRTSGLDQGLQHGVAIDDEAERIDDEAER